MEATSDNRFDQKFDFKVSIPKREMLGEKLPQAKLSEVEVSKIRKMRAAGIMAREIIENLNLSVSTTQIYRIAANHQRRTG